MKFFYHFNDELEPFENLISCYLYVRHDGLIEKVSILLKASNVDRMCEEFDYGGLHHEEPHFPCFYEKDRYNKEALKWMIENTEFKFLTMEE